MKQYSSWSLSQAELDAYKKYVGEIGNSKKFILTLDNLRNRWLDEHEYEDWKDYEKVMRSFLPAEVRFIRSTKRPIGMVVEIPNITRQVHIYLKYSKGYMCVSGKVL
jgi:hypothetical protein